LESNAASLTQKLTFILECAHPGTLEWLKSLKAELLQSGNGNTQVQLLCTKESQKGVLSNLPESLRWKINVRVLRKLLSHPCVAGARATATTFTPPEKKWGNYGGNGGGNGKFAKAKG